MTPMNKMNAQDREALRSDSNSELPGQIIDWMESNFPRIRQSGWYSEINVLPIDVLETLIAPAYMAIRSALLPPASAQTNHSWVLRKLKRVPNRTQKFWLKRRAQSLSLQPDHFDVIFWPVEPTHVNAQLPVAAALNTQSVKVGFVSSKPNITHLLTSRGIQHLYTENNSWKHEIDRARRTGQNLFRGRTLRPDWILDPLPHATSNEMSSELMVSLFVRHIPWVLETSKATELIRAYCNPRVLVVGNDITLTGRTVAMCAQKNNLPTASLMHGAAIDLLQPHHIVDRFLAYGEISRNWLIERGAQPQQIVATGSPLLDNVPRQTYKPHPAVRKLIGLDDTDKFVLLANSGTGYISQSHLNAITTSIMSISGAMPDIVFATKLHRNENIEDYMKLQRTVSQSKLRIYPNNISNTSIMDWLQGCSLVITSHSTVALEAMVMDVPVMTIDLHNEVGDIDYIEARATQHITDADQIMPTIISLLDPSSADREDLLLREKNFIKKYYSNLDGQAATATAKAILEMM